MVAFVHLNGMNCGTDISGAIDLISPNEPHVSILGVDFHDRWFNSSHITCLCHGVAFSFPGHPPLWRDSNLVKEVKDLLFSFPKHCNAQLFTSNRSRGREIGGFWHPKTSIHLTCANLTRWCVTSEFPIKSNTAAEHVLSLSRVWFNFCHKISCVRRTKVRQGPRWA